MEQLTLLYFLTANDGEGVQSIWQIVMVVWLAVVWLVLAVALMSTAYTEPICKEYWCYSALWATV